MAQVIDNSFSLHKMTNEASICGYPFLAVNVSRRLCISISEDHFSISPVCKDVTSWLLEDYRALREFVAFDSVAFTQLIHRYFCTSDYSLTAYASLGGSIHSLEIALNKFDDYYEVHFSVEDGTFKTNTAGSGRKQKFEVGSTYSIDVFLSLAQILSAMKQFGDSLFV